jgi:hypothetical protein
MSEMKQKIDHAMQQVERDTSLTADHRESMLDMLLPASIAANGTSDKIGAIANAIGAQSIYLARRDRHISSIISTAISEHVRVCPMATPVMAGKLGILYPFRWPLAVILAVAMLSPYVGPVVKDVAKEHFEKPQATQITINAEQSQKK